MGSYSGLPGVPDSPLTPAMNTDTRGHLYLKLLEPSSSPHGKSVSENEVSTEESLTAMNRERLSFYVTVSISTPALAELSSSELFCFVNAPPHSTFVLLEADLSWFSIL